MAGGGKPVDSEREGSRGAASPRQKPSRFDLSAIIKRRASQAACSGAGMAAANQAANQHPRLTAVLALAILAGCVQQNRGVEQSSPRTRVLAVAPVLNLSGSLDFDPLKVTDLIASEFLSFEGIAVIPVNLALAELDRQGKQSIETAQDAVRLAQALGADATIVVAVTEYDPYPPPVVGLIMQWYSANPQSEQTVTELAGASDSSGGQRSLLSDQASGPLWQVQKVYDASDQEVVKDIRSFAARRDGHQSPYGWRRYIQSQTLYMRYASWATIRTMLSLDTRDRMPSQPDEANR